MVFHLMHMQYHACGHFTNEETGLGWNNGCVPEKPGTLLIIVK